jgi:hypothetical protein
MSHGIFHDILPKEYSGTFPEPLWEEEDNSLYIERPTTNEGSFRYCHLEDLYLNKVYTILKGFFTVNSTIPAKIMQAFPLNY